MVSACQVGSAKNPLEAKEFNLALARTRQAMHVNKAVQMMRTGSPSRSSFCIRPGQNRLWKRSSVLPSPCLAVNTRCCDMAVRVCRALVELQRALQENSAARCPVLSAHYDKEDVGGPSTAIIADDSSHQAVTVQVFRAECGPV